MSARAAESRSVIRGWDVQERGEGLAVCGEGGAAQHRPGRDGGRERVRDGPSPGRRLCRHAQPTRPPPARRRRRRPPSAGRRTTAVPTRRHKSRSPRRGATARGRRRSHPPPRPAPTRRPVIARQGTVPSQPPRPPGDHRTGTRGPCSRLIARRSPTRRARMPRLTRNTTGQTDSPWPMPTHRRERRLAVRTETQRGETPDSPTRRRPPDPAAARSAAAPRWRWRAANTATAPPSPTTCGTPSTGRAGRACARPATAATPRASRPSLPRSAGRPASEDPSTRRAHHPIRRDVEPRSRRTASRSTAATRDRRRHLSCPTAHLTCTTSRRRYRVNSPDGVADASACSSFSRPRSSTRRIFPEIVFGSAANSSRRIRL